EMLPLYEKEHNHFVRKIDSLKQVNSQGQKKERESLVAASVELDSAYQVYELRSGESIFSDNDSAVVKDIAPELSGLQAIKVSNNKQIKEGTSLRIYVDQPVKLLVGYFEEDKVGYASDNRKSIFAPKPTLEYDANANN